jgi:RecB family exonuclease
MPFGFDGLEPVHIKLPDGRELDFRGRADRVDRSLDGTLTVLDYKTGKGAGYDEVEDDPVVRGQRLQLPLYAAAARQQLGADDVHAYYWFATRAGKYQQFGYELDAPRQVRFESVLTEIVDGIESGVFPAEPGQANWFFGTFENCAFCEFDELCPSDRDAHWEAIAEAPQLVRFRRLADGTDQWSLQLDAECEADRREGGGA